MTQTYLQTKTTVSLTGASSGVAISGLTGDFTVKLKIWSLTAGDTARISIEEAPGDNFSSGVVAAASFNFLGPLPGEGIVASLRKRELAKTSLFGTAGAYARVNVTELVGGSLTFEAWIES